MANKKDLKGYIRYDGNGRVIPGALLLQRFKPSSGGKWHEIPAYECCNSGPVLALKLTFDSIENANILVGDATNVNDWNTLFELPINGNPFTSVIVVDNEVQLIGGSDISLNNRLGAENSVIRVIDTAGCVISFSDNDVFYYCENLLEVSLPAITSLTNNNFEYCIDLITINLPLVTTIGITNFVDCYSLTSINMPLITSIGDSSFQNCTLLTYVNFPILTSIGNSSFSGCESLISISLPSCTNLGDTIGDDNVFNNILGNNITLTVPSALMTVDAGDPDGDIQYLIVNNTVTVITV